MTRRMIVMMGVLLLLVPASGLAQALRPAARITSQTTTVLVASVAGKTVGITGGAICVDGNGATTGVAIQSTAGTNLVGTGIVWVLAAGQCLFFPRTGDPYFAVTAKGTGLQVVTTVGSGPIEAYLEVVQR